MQLAIDEMKLREVITSLSEDVNTGYASSCACIGECAGVVYVLTAYKPEEADEDGIPDLIPEHNCITESH